jgi:hypothetical protein
MFNANCNNDITHINHIQKQKIDKYKKIFEKTKINDNALKFLNNRPIKNITLQINSKSIEIPINIDNDKLPSDVNLISAIYWKLNNFPTNLLNNPSTNSITNTSINSITNTSNDVYPPINLIINTHEINERHYYYFNIVQPWQHLEKQLTDESVGMYSFCLRPMDSLNCSGIGKISRLVIELGINNANLNQLLNSNASIDLTIQYNCEQEAYLNFLIKKRKYQSQITDYNNFMHCLKTCRQNTSYGNFNKIDNYLMVIICDYLF